MSRGILQADRYRFLYDVNVEADFTSCRVLSIKQCTALLSFAIMGISH
jgi:hypothetical protein